MNDATRTRQNAARPHDQGGRDDPPDLSALAASAAPAAPPKKGMSAPFGPGQSHGAAPCLRDDRGRVAWLWS